MLGLILNYSIHDAASACRSHEKLHFSNQLECMTWYKNMHAFARTVFDFQLQCRKIWVPHSRLQKDMSDVFREESSANIDPRNLLRN
jgi:hypothetical protein